MTEYSELSAKCLARFEGHDYHSGGPPVFVWHLHHGQLVEPLTEPIVNRVKYILANKPAHEIATRLEWLRLVLGVMPVECVRVGAEYIKVRTEYNKFWTEYDGGRVEYDRVGAEYNKLWIEYDRVRTECNRVYTRHRTELLQLHTSECPGCPWDEFRSTLVFEAAEAAKGEGSC